MSSDISSREFAFVASCCRSAFAGRSQLGPDTEGLDWPRVVRLAQFHRVETLVWKGLAANGVKAPGAQYSELLVAAKGVAAANLRFARECQNLVAAFKAWRVPLLLVKGLTLGALAYGDASIKAAVDIDALVSENRLEETAGLLRQAGYELVSPSGSPGPRRLLAWHRLRKESSWLRGNMQVDLHTRLADNPRLIPSIGLDSPRQSVEVFPGINLETLANDELFAYLAVHGASSAWFRLKWITDFAAFAHRLEADSIPALYQRSQQLGAGRAAGQALLLADRIFGTLGSVPGLAEQLSRDRPTVWLCRVALGQLAGREEPVEPTSVPLGTAAIHYSQLLMMPEAAFIGSEFIRQLRSLFV